MFTGPARAARLFRAGRKVRRRRCGGGTGLRGEPPYVLQLAEHDAIAAASVVALSDGQPDRAFMLVESWVLKGFL